MCKEAQVDQIAGASAEQMAHPPADVIPDIVDGLPLIKAATDLKEEGSAKFRAKLLSEAASCYERGIEILDKADGHPMLRSEAEQLISLKATLYGNVAQCLIGQELWRRAIDAASECLKIDEKNTKALHRRSVANEALRQYPAALGDCSRLRELGGGVLSEEVMDSRIAALCKKQDAVDRAKAEESSDDECDTDLVELKRQFDDVVEKYDMRDGAAASEIADWLTSGEWVMSATRVSQRFKMELEDADVLLRWIAKGLEFKVQNAENQGHAQSASPIVQMTE